MDPTDEELLHAFYAGDNNALNRLAERRHAVLTRITFLILFARSGSIEQALHEWDVADLLDGFWEYVGLTQRAVVGRWPDQRLSALTWLIHVLCLELDRHLGIRPPF